MYTIKLQNGDTIDVEDKWFKVYSQGRVVEGEDGCFVSLNGTGGAEDMGDFEAAKVDSAIVDYSIVG